MPTLRFKVLGAQPVPGRPHGGAHLAQVQRTLAVWRAHSRDGDCLLAGGAAQGAMAEEEGRAEDGQTSMGGAGLEDRRQQVREEEAVEGED